MTLDQIQRIHEAIGDRSEKELITAANLTLEFSGSKAKLVDPAQADLVLRKLLQSLLDSDNYLFAAALLWSRYLFDTRPQYTQDVFRKIPETNQLLILGAVSTGKTYGAVAWCYLDWRRDPEYTMIKIAAVSEEHLKRNSFAHLKKLHRDAAIPLEAKESELYLGIEGSGEDMGFAGVMFPAGKDPSSRIRGYKPRPYRKTEHPRFGRMTRVRFLGDDSQSWSEGLFLDVGSLQGSIDGLDLIKIILSFNAPNTEVPVVRKAEPYDGWRIEDLDTLYEWISREGWDVLRLDGMRCENVVQRAKIFPALIGYEGAQKFIRGGGDNSADYFEKLRGFPPLRNAKNTIIPPQYPVNFRGEATFIDSPINVGSLDCAYQGEDKAVLTVGRYGLASGWTKANGDSVVFMNPMSPADRMPRHVLQYDQQLPMTDNSDTVKLALEVKETCILLGVDTKHFAIDGTGNGFGTYSHLKTYWGDVLLIEWGKSATEHKVLAEDAGGADTLYDNIISEMWFTTKRWFESGVIIISQQIPISPLNSQLTTRRYGSVRGGLLRTESKLEYKSRGNPSPDEVDSFIMLSFLVRMRCEVLPGIQLESNLLAAQKRPDPDSDIPASDAMKESTRMEHEFTPHA
jgi:hypothetical protein